MVSKLLRKEILITGATGFIGANLTRYLINLGCRPHIIIRKESNLWRINKFLKKVNLHYVDLRDKERVKQTISRIKPKVIYHCATYGGYPYEKDFYKIIQTNIIGTLNLLNACTRFNFDCFINTGTSSEYGIKKQPMKESDLPEPLTDYGVSKASVTLFCQTVARREKLPIVTLRLFSPYGYYEEQNRLIPTVILSCLNKESPKLSSPRSIRDFIFVEDVMEAFIKVVENSDKIKGEILNIGYGRQHSVGDIVSKIISLVPEKVKPLWQSVSNPRIEPSIWVADISKTKKLLNWHPRHNLDQGLKKTIDWFRKNIGLYRDKD